MKDLTSINLYHQHTLRAITQRIPSNALFHSNVQLFLRVLLFRSFSSALSFQVILSRWVSLSPGLSRKKIAWALIEPLEALVRLLRLVWWFAYRSKCRFKLGLTWISFGSHFDLTSNPTWFEVFCSLRLQLDRRLSDRQRRIPTAFFLARNTLG